MTSTTPRAQSPTASTKSSPSAGTKRKREPTTKFYAVHIGHTRGVYHTYADCIQQVTGYPKALFKAFPTLTEAENFVANGYDAAARFARKPQKYYAVRAGFNPGIYTDWDAAKKQVTGFVKPRHKAFHTQAEAQSFIDGNDNPEPEHGASKKLKKAVSTNEIDDNVPAGSGPMPPISDDGFDARIILNPESKEIEYKNEAQRKAVKMQATGLAEDKPIVIYTDGSSLGNGQPGSFAGVGIYFGPLDPKNVGESLKGSRQTNQRAELTAISRAMDLSPKDRHIEIRTDSKYSIDCVTNWFQNWRRNGWKTANGKSVENKDLVEAILEKIEHRNRLGSKTTFQWIKGHANEPGNVAADGLAVTAAYKAKEAARNEGVASEERSLADA